MCRYRYYYFSGCGHQKTVLYDFCSDAPSIPKPQSVNTPGKNDAQTSDDDVEAAGGGGGTGSSDGSDSSRGIMAEGTLQADNTDLPSLCSTGETHSSLSHKSSFDTTSVSITTEHSLDCSSLPSRHLKQPSPSADSSDSTMAGLPLFGGTFRQWMGGGTTTTPKPSTIDPQVHMSMSGKGPMEALQNLSSGTALASSRVRQPGIREHTDESCDLPKSNEIMQHLAESCRNDNGQSVGTDGCRLLSYSSTETHYNDQHDFEATRHAYDNIEAEIDQLKENIVKLKQEADQESAAGHEQNVHTRTTAALPQKKSETRASGPDCVSQNQSKTSQQSIQPSTTALDGGRPGPNASSRTDHIGQPRKLSYADVASHGTRHDKSRVSSATIAKPSDAATIPHFISPMLSPAETSSTAASLDSEEAKDEDEYSVIISRRGERTEPSANDSVVVSKGVQSAQNGKPENKQPRFAQPTQSFSRRTGETIRPGCSPASAKSSPSGSPIKTTRVKEPTLATDKRAAQRQQKRKSLPGDWLVVGIQPTDPCAKVPATKGPTETTTTPEKEAPLPVDATSSTCAEGWKEVDGHHVKDGVTTVRAKAGETQAKSPLAARTKSYMAPTNAATQRAIATLGQEKATRDSQESKPVVNQFRDLDFRFRAVAPHRSSTASSEVSSVQFILHQPRPEFSLVHSPNGNNASSASEKSQDTHHRTRIDSVVSPSKITPPHDRKLNSPSKLPKSSPHVESHLYRPYSRIQTPTNSPGVGSLPPEVPNTTTTRRTSHGHILQPIVACLDAKGLLNKTSSNNAVVQSYLKAKAADGANNASNVLCEKENQQPSHPFESNATVTPRALDAEPVSHVLAPHLCGAREVSQASTSTDATICPEQSSIMNFTAPIFGPANEMAGLVSDAPTAHPPMLKSARVSSLRATAHEFRPTVPAEAFHSQMDVPNIMRYIPEHDWCALSWEEKLAICNLRRLYYHDAWRAGSTLPAQYHYYSAANTFPGNLDVDNVPMYNDAEVTIPHVEPPVTKAVDENGSPHTVQAGQILRPSLSPGKRSVHWTLRDVDGKETPIKFGRAPAPHVSPIWTPPTPAAISSNSNATSPAETPHSLRVRGWEIGSASSPVPYGWRGGDGKEIKFVGYGPHAERDPNSVVNFSFRGSLASYNAVSVPNGFDKHRENGSGSSSASSAAAAVGETHVAPRSQRQWAEKFGFAGPGGVGKVPCGKVEIVRAVEHCIPFGSQLAGYCFDCMAG